MTKNSLLYKGFGLTAAALLVSGCSNVANQEADPTKYEQLSATGTIETGANMRYDPFKLEGDFSNLCSKLAGPIALKNTGVFVTDQHDNNGEWIGLSINQLPPEVRSDCGADNDRIVWVNSSANLDGTTSPDPSFNNG